MMKAGITHHTWLNYQWLNYQWLNYQWLNHQWLKGTAIPLVALLLMLFLAGAGTVSAEDTDPIDPEYETLLTENPDDQEQLRDIEALLSSDIELEDSFIAYEDSLATHPELAGQEEELAEALAGDPELQRQLTEFEGWLSSDPESAGRMASYDSLMSSNPELAEAVEEMERLAAEDPDILESHGEAMAAIEGDSELAAEIFAEEDGPTDVARDPAVSAYIIYLRGHPAYYHTGWRIYHYARLHPPAARGLYSHWRWFHPRRDLWRSWWGCRIRAAHNVKVHKILWRRRAYLGRRPALAHQVYRHRMVVLSRPALRCHMSFLSKHQRLARAVVKHRKQVRHYNVHKAKPVRQPNKNHKAKPDKKAPPPPKAKKPSNTR
ncbi:MAG: hypothetical protein KJ927_10770, partial [Candidatus Eisenbacteria bacterium]|nr:hypothetical protein [Candidatus Eisenbacteria bacterium]